MARALLFSLVIIALFGVVVPLMKGFFFLNPLLLCAYLMLGVVIVAPAAASTFSGTEAVNGRDAVRRLGLVSVYAWGLSLAVVGVGLITVNVASRYAHAALPSASFLAAGVLCSATAIVFAALVSAVVARSYSDATARNAVRLAFLGVVIFAFALSRFGGPEWVRAVFRWSTTAHVRNACMVGAVVLAAGDVVLALVLSRKLSRSAAAS